MNARALFWTSVAISCGAFGVAWYFHLQHTTMAREHTARLSQLESLKRSESHASRRALTPVAATLKRKSFAELEAEFRRNAKAEYDRWQNIVSESPDLQELEAQAELASMQTRFAGFFRQKNLTSEQREAFLSAVARSMTQTKALTAARREKGLPPDAPELSTMRQQAETELQRELEALIGPDPFVQTRAYDSLSEARTYLANHGALLARLGDPLTHEQLDRLAVLFRDLDPRRANPANLTSAQWTAFTERARGILNPKQMEIFQTASPDSVGPLQKHVEELLARIAGPKGS